MKDLKNNVVVVTGAASGMGRELAIQLADLGCNLALCDVNELELEKTVSLIKNKSVKVKADILNVADEKAVYKYADDIVNYFGHVDRVFNNAGKVVTNSLNEVSLDDFRLVMDINFWGVVYGTKAFLPHLLKRKDASIVNTSSVNAFIPFPNNGPYNCSKFAVCGFNESLHQELVGTSVNVLSVHPGGIKTNIVRNAKFIQGANPKISHEKSAKFFEKIAGTSASKAASVMITAMRKDKKRLMIGKDAYFFDYFKRLMPKTAVSFIGKMASR